MHFGNSSIFFLSQIKVREGGTDWGWGVVVNVIRKPATGSGPLPSGSSSSRGGYIVDTLLHCSEGSHENSARTRPSPALPGEKGEMHVVSLLQQIIYRFIFETEKYFDDKFVWL